MGISDKRLAEERAKSRVAVILQAPRPLTGLTEADIAAAVLAVFEPGLFMQNVIVCMLIDQLRKQRDQKGGAAVGHIQST